MKIVGIIPSRYKSTRFEGKPLADIHGKPMIWWVWNQAREAQKIDELYVATDDDRIAAVCEQYQMKYIMTSPDHKTPIDRLQEISGKIAADIYVCVNGDEPLIEPELIDSVIPDRLDREYYVGGAVTVIHNAVEVVDFTISKVVVNSRNELLWSSRSPIPYPKGSMEFKYKKLVGIQAMNKAALDFYVNTERSQLELAEECDLYRFLENGIKISVVEYDSHSVSVDTRKDLEYVKGVLLNRQEII